MCNSLWLITYFNCILEMPIAYQLWRHRQFAIRDLCHVVNGNIIYSWTFFTHNNSFLALICLNELLSIIFNALIAIFLYAWCLQCNYTINWKRINKKYLNCWIINSFIIGNISIIYIFFFLDFFQFNLV